MQPDISPDAEQVAPSGGLILGRMMVDLLIGGVLFILLWAGLNFGFGTLLDGPIGAFVMEPPCQRLARTNERLTGYSPGKAGGGGRATSPSVCYFGSRAVKVAGQTDGLGFTAREGLLIVGGLVGYMLCFITALVGAVYLVGLGRRLVRGVPHLIKRNHHHSKGTGARGSAAASTPSKEK
ncbi:MAG: hypothetical protein ABL891_07425 [Burkholderiales bacterium]